jgi:phenylalanyl-tRNA synthetase alpha chain
LCDMEEALTKIREASIADLRTAASEADIYQVKSAYIGRNGSLTQLIKNIITLAPEQRAVAGKLANEIKKGIESAVEDALKAARDRKKQQGMVRADIDVTLPGRALPLGRRHPITQVTDQIVSVFTELGFQTVEGPEIELDFFNFEALNIPKDHPARDMHDTFYIAPEVLLRTHTSPVQIRTMQQTKPPLRIICPGKVYRCDSDVSHTPMFHQIEGLMVDEHISFGDLKGLLTLFIHRIFDDKTALRFRPSFFPFTEPSAEVDIQCVMCRGKGCRVCKGTGWLEILGSGMVHPAVLRNVGYDPEATTGLAFGLGVERVTMLKYGINDIRLFFENDLRFLSQF